MSKRLVASILTGAAVLIGAEIYKFHRGINEESAIIADFNNDGKADMVYLDPFDRYSAIVFVDGNNVKQENGKYLHTSFGEHIGFLPGTTRKYDIAASDMNDDGKGNFRLSPESNLFGRSR